MLAHPRVCGENNQLIMSFYIPEGSSPRVRGKLGGQAGVDVRLRLIPACAGKTGTASQQQRHQQAHPRVCGENPPRTPRPEASAGSSPRVRGKPSAWYSPLLRVGLIPACAGKTPAPDTTTHPHPAHPRVCGENLSRPIVWIAGFGSSPRVRGKLVRAQRAQRHRGLIPACAGKTLPTAVAAPMSQAHPRVCGENPDTTVGDLVAWGSSPRVRGKRGRRVARLGQARLIPACAGKTSSIGYSTASCTAHPRVCGENQDDGGGGHGGEGSSPRVRGKQDAGVGAHRRVRLIPACAGKTSRK